MPIPVLIASSLHHGNDYIMFQWFVGLSIILFGLSTSIYSKFTLLPALSFFYLAMTALVVMFCSHNMYSQEALYLPYFSSASGQALACLVLITMCNAFMNYSVVEMDVFISLFCLVNALYVIFGNFSGYGITAGGVGVSGFIDYSGMNGCMMAMTFPYLIDAKPKWFLMIPVLCAIYMSRSSVPYGVLIVSITAYLLHQKRSLSLNSSGAIGVPVVIFTFYQLLVLQIQSLFDSAFRFDAYKIFLTAWYHKASHLFGTGLGTFQVWGPIIQTNTGFMIHPGATSFYWPWMHSDWLQCLFENGFIGLLLVLITFIVALFKLYNKKQEPRTFALACGLGSSAIFDYPMRYFGMAFLAAYVIKVAYEVVDA